MNDVLAGSGSLIINVPVIANTPPKPKGSLRHIGGHRMVEQVKGSTTWRTAVAWHARHAMTTHNWTTTKAPVRVDVDIWLPRNGSKHPYPAGGRTGDVDKHARNILDALADAGVYANDSQVVALTVTKRYEAPSRVMSARIVVRIIEDVA